jgi:hypothetical protein
LIERLDVRAPPIFINPNLWNFEPCAKNGAGSFRFVGSCAPLRYQNIALAGQTLGKRLGTEQRGNRAANAGGATIWISDPGAPDAKHEKNDRTSNC